MSVELSMYKLADLMQMALKVESGKVSGKTKARVTLNCGLIIPVTVKAIKMFAADQTGVLFHVMADLYIIASHYPKTGGLGAYVLDASGLQMDGVKAPPEMFISSKMNVGEVVTAVRSGIKAAFHYKSGKWNSLTLPK